MHVRVSAFILSALLSGLFCSSSVAETRQLTHNVELVGTFSQGGMVIGKCSPACGVYLNNQNVRVSRQGDFVFGFGRDAETSQRLRISRPKQADIQYPFTIKQRKYNLQSVTGVPQATVNPPPEVMERIAREQAMVDAARGGFSDRLDFLSGFDWPVKGRISGVYGSQRIYNGQAGNPHYGLDIAGPVGKEVRAPADGRVTLAQPDLYFSGGTLIIDHGYGIFTSYIHLSKVIAKTGQEVKHGEVIAKIGATGRASGPHLDWRINWFKDRLDPLYTLPPQ